MSNIVTRFTTTEGYTEDVSAALMTHDKLPGMLILGLPIAGIMPVPLEDLSNGMSTVIRSEVLELTIQPATWTEPGDAVDITIEAAPGQVVTITIKNEDIDPFLNTPSNEEVSAWADTLSPEMFLDEPGE